MQMAMLEALSKRKIALALSSIILFCYPAA